MKTGCIDYKSLFYGILLSILICISGCMGGEDGEKTPVPLSPAPPSPAPVASQNGEGIKWLSSFDTARDEARKSKKILMLHFYTTWGDWSKKMDKETYTYYKVIDLSKNFVCVKIDLDKNEDMESRYNISGHPTIVFEDPFTGKEVKRIEGIRDRHEMTNEMNSMLSYKVKFEGDSKDE